MHGRGCVHGQDGRRRDGGREWYSRAGGGGAYGMRDMRGPINAGRTAAAGAIAALAASLSHG